MTTPSLRRLEGQEGFALAFALLFTLAIVALLIGSLAMSSGAFVLTRSAERESLLVRGAETGLEWGRIQLNEEPELFPTEGYVVLEDGEPVLDSEGGPVPGTERWIYAGPAGITTGQFGIFGMIVAVVRDGGGGVVIRRSQLYQESFARFAYFTDLEQTPGGQTIYFTGGDQLNGPVHSNDHIQILNPEPIFLAEVRSAETITQADLGDFRRGFQENVPRIELPGTAELDHLRSQAQLGGTAFTPPVRGDGLPTLRLEFIGVDLDGDGQVTGANEGFFRAYQLNAAAAANVEGPRYLMAEVPGTGIFDSPNCGRHPATPANTFQPASGVTAANSSYDRLTQSSPGSTCYLGGDPRLFGSAFGHDQAASASAADPRGGWLTTGLPIPSGLGSVRNDAAYLYPTTRLGNPEFRGVIFVDGSVAVSGVLRGRVTIAATGNIYLADDFEYATSPGGGTCEDIMGLFAQEDVRMANSTRTHRVRIPQANISRPVQYRDFGNPNGTTVDGIVLALESFTTDGYQFPDRQSQLAGFVPSNTPTPYFRDCENSNISIRPWSRGCLYLTGGIIQRTRGPVAQLSGGAYTGYAKRYDYDQCGATNPPPYFPTTGRFFGGQTYQVDPVGFDVDDYFEMLSGG